MGGGSGPSAPLSSGGRGGPRVGRAGTETGGGKRSVSAMRGQTRNAQRVCLILVLFNTLAGSFIWGINTLFLLDAGLSNTAAFAANAFWTAGMVLFEVPTGVVADTW